MTPKNRPTDRRRRALSALEYLDQEERRASEALKASLLAAGEELCQVTDVRGVVRRHPVIALSAAAALGAALAPLLAEALQHALPGGQGGKGTTIENAGVWMRRAARLG